MRKSFRQIAAISAIAAAGSLLGGAAWALGPELAADRPPATSNPSSGVLQLRYAAQDSITRAQDVVFGRGEVQPAPTPKPSIHPEGYVNSAIQTVASALGNAAQGLGGVRVGPIPAPTPSVRPVADRATQTANVGIQTVAGALGNAAQGLGGVRVGPIPAPTPSVIPLPGG